MKEAAPNAWWVRHRASAAAFCNESVQSKRVITLDRDAMDVFLLQSVAEHFVSSRK
jgi:hypothetical protein